MEKSKKILAVSALGLGLTGIVSPAYAADMVVGLQNWPSAAATAHIIKVAIEDNLELDVELQNGTNAVIFEAMDKGSMDVMPEVWLPNQQNLHDTYVAGKGSVALNQTGMPASQGLCVPDYVANLLRNINFSADEVSAMTYALVVDKQEPETFAKQWVADHQDAVIGWFTQ